MAKKKVIILIVEGITDQLILEIFLEQIMNKRKLHIEFYGGDPFGERREKLKSPKELIGDIVKEIMEKRKFHEDDIIFIGQVTDTDGIYIPEGDFKVGADLDDFSGKSYKFDLDKKQVYFSSEKARNDLIETWKQKRNLIKALKSGIHYKRKIPYLLFYNSLDLEHVTLGRQVRNKDKDREANTFIDSLNESFGEFYKFLELKLTSETFEDSWEEIQHNKDWNIAKSNLKLLIDKLEEVEG